MRVASPESLSNSIREEAHRLGFDLCRIASLQDLTGDSPQQKEAPHADFFEQWIGLGRQGEMHYLARNQEKRRNPALLADGLAEPGFKSLIVLAVNHFQFSLPSQIIDDPSRGLIASYAWGDDYHELIRPALYELDAFIREQTGRSSQGKCLVDTGPVLERDWAHHIGLGFTGKNCCTIHPRLGSWLLLATIAVPETLAQDEPLQSFYGAAQPPRQPSVPTQRVTPKDIIEGLPPEQEYGRWEVPLATNSGGNQGAVTQPTILADGTDTGMGTCGRCTRCLDDCPTDAFVGPYHLDPQRCISYWTIEARSAIPRDLRPLFGNRIFGCDICQEVCPWNQRLDERTPQITALVAQAERVAPHLLEGFASDTPYWVNQAAFSARFRRSPIKRAKRAGMLRNVCVALGNWGDPIVLKALQMALADPEPLPRAHAAWAVGQVATQHGDSRCHEILTAALMNESIESVREEIQRALR